MDSKNNKEEKISIIIPVYNDTTNLLKLTDKIISDSKNNKTPNIYEILIIDDNSNDNPYIALLSKLKDNTNKKITAKRKQKQTKSTISISKKITITYIRTTKTNKDYPKGAAHARNIGIKNAAGKILIFIDSDVIISLQTIDDLANDLKKADFSYPKIVYPNNTIFYPESKKEKKMLYISCCFATRKETLDDIKTYYNEIFDEKYKIYNEDSDLFFRAMLLKKKFYYDRNLTIIHNSRKKDIVRKEARWKKEIRNLAYGHFKIKKLKTKRTIAKRFSSKTQYNPFKRTILAKAFLLSIMNFSWFEFSDYKTKKHNITKRITMLASFSNRFTKKSIFWRTKKFFLLFNEGKKMARDD